MAADQEKEGDERNRLEDPGNEDLTYTRYLQLETLLSCQKPVDCGRYTHDQMLFIITHQVYELWFKQIIYEVDSVREIFSGPYLDEGKMLVINDRLMRCVLICKTLVDQVAILETMTALDFMDFREHLQAASGFQSLQFRILENKLGVKDEHRVRYNKQNYRSVFTDPTSAELVKQSVEQPSLQQLLQHWLARTPGLEVNGFNFWQRYKDAVKTYLDNRFCIPIENETDPKVKELHVADYIKQKDAFDTILEEDKYNFFVKTGERQFSYRAFQGAMMIAMYRNEPRFSQPFQMLNLLMDIDSLITKWRHNHVMMVQRMIGTKLGTGGSSGYQYLRSTVSDRYKPFLDLCNLSTYLVSRDCIPPLNQEMKVRLSTMNLHYSDEGPSTTK